MSPEQLRGLPVDRRTDVWAFGCVPYELLSGRRAFAGERASDVVAKIIEREPNFDLLPASAPPALRRLLERCLAKDLGRRLRDIGDARLEIAQMRAALREDPGAPYPVAPAAAYAISAAAAAVTAVAAALGCRC